MLDLPICHAQACNEVIVAEHPHLEQPRAAVVAVRDMQRERSG
jgi:hypothetical protein